MNCYEIKYEVDTGFDFVRDIALVKAETEGEAVEKLKGFIGDTGYEHMVSDVFYVREFIDEVFSSKFMSKSIREMRRNAFAQQVIGGRYVQHV